jgi:hypothetical protein
MISPYHLKNLKVSHANALLTNSDIVYYVADVYLLENRIIYAQSVLVINFTETILTELFSYSILQLKEAPCVYTLGPSSNYAPLNERNAGLLARIHSMGNTSVSYHKAYLPLSVIEYLSGAKVSGISANKHPPFPL